MLKHKQNVHLGIPTSFSMDIFLRKEIRMKKKQQNFTNSCFWAVV
jgi:hypothetical protein